MSKLVVKVGMKSEFDIAKFYAAPGTVILTGRYSVTGLDLAIPSDCEAILSFGVCGGLAPWAQIGQAFICRTLLTPDGKYIADPAWRKRLFAVTGYYERPWWSTGEFNTADTVEQREELFITTGCWVIDDETHVVAKVARKRGIAFQALRTVSDSAADNLPPAVVNALNPNGTTDLLAVIKSVVMDPLQIPALIDTAIKAKKALDDLGAACRQVGPRFQW